MWLGTSAKMSATPSVDGTSDSYLQQRPAQCHKIYLPAAWAEAQSAKRHRQQVAFSIQHAAHGI